MYLYIHRKVAPVVKPAAHPTMSAWWLGLVVSVFRIHLEYFFSTIVTNLGSVFTLSKIAERCSLTQSTWPLTAGTICCIEDLVLNARTLALEAKSEAITPTLTPPPMRVLFKIKFE